MSDKTVHDSYAELPPQFLECRDYRHSWQAFIKKGKT
jgi:hypothetical protein